MNDSTNGKEAPFALTRVKSPEEIAREQMRKLMPEHRRAVNELRIPAQSKWLFATISDDSFMNTFGGDGFGTVVTTIKKLSQQYKHDRDSISKWLDCLDNEEVVWLEYEYPFLIIHITAVVPLPKHRAGVVQRMKARASAARISRAEDTRTSKTGFSAAPESETARFTEGIRTLRGDVPASRAEDTRTACGHLPQTVRKVSAQNGGQHPHVGGVTPADRAGTSPHGVRTPSARLAEDNRIAPPESSIGTVTNSSSKTSPSVKSQIGEVPSKRSTGLNARKAASGTGKSLTAENLFLLDVGAMMELWRKGSSKAELDQSGAWWRTAFRANPELMRRVLAETLRKVKEGQIKKTPGQSAVYDWQLWGGRKPAPAKNFPPARVPAGV